MAYLILVRHGESTWNKEGLWTGWTDVPLSETGIQEAKKAGESLKDLPIDIAFTSDLTRAKQTLSEILKVLGKENLSITIAPELKERDYGIYTGKNKWDIQKELGDEKFKNIRRSFTYPIPEGETLEDVYNRTIPYFKNEILPKLKSGQNVLISAHGNSLRALVKYLDNLSDDEVADLEIKTGETILYDFDTEGNIKSKKTIATNSKEV